MRQRMHQLTPSAAGSTTITADRRVRIALFATLLAFIALAWQAQAAHATYGKVTVVKVNEGGPTADTFGFTTSLVPSASSFSIAGGQQKTFSVECNVDRPGKANECKRWGYPTLKITEGSTPGYALKGIVCRSKLDKTEPTTSSALDTDTTVSGSTITFKVLVNEWVKCWVTNRALTPKIAIDKTGPPTAVAGDLISYELDVSNPGEVSFAAAKVVVADALCVAAPALASTNGDGTPGTLDPGDVWTYGCQVQSAVGQTEVVNTGTVKGTDSRGTDVSDSDDATTTLSQPQPPVTPPTTSVPTTTATPSSVAAASTTPTAGTTAAKPSSARIHGAASCVRTATTPNVTGRNIVKVTFYVDGKRVKTVAKADAKGRWKVPLSVRNLGFGRHRVEARVQFTAASGTAPKKLRISVRRCAASAAQPQFTG